MVHVSSVTVGGPQTRGENVSLHIVYAIVTELAQREPGLDATLNVVRRFSDFQWLREALRAQFPYLVVPMLPERSALNNSAMLVGKAETTDEFAEARHRALQRWIERVCAHPELSSTGAFFPAFCDV